MCEGKELADSKPAPSPPLAGAAYRELRRRAAVTDSELAAARARLAESLAALERERARAAALRRRLAESYAERGRLKRMAAAIEVVRDRIRESRLRLQEHLPESTS